MNFWYKAVRLAMKSPCGAMRPHTFVLEVMLVSKIFNVDLIFTKSYPTSDIGVFWLDLVKDCEWLMGSSVDRD